MHQSESANEISDVLHSLYRRRLEFPDLTEQNMDRRASSGTAFKDLGLRERGLSYDPDSTRVVHAHNRGDRLLRRIAPTNPATIHAAIHTGNPAADMDAC